MKVFIISKDNFIRKAFELIASQQNKDVFTIDDCVEARHFIEDLKPSIILFDIDDLEESSVNELVENLSTQIPVVYTSKEDSSKSPFFKKPLDAMNLFNELESIYNKEK